MSALLGPLPAADRFESNDDAGAVAAPVRLRRAAFTATIDFWDDPVDVYKTYLRRGQRFALTLAGPRGSDVDVVLWRPGTQRVDGLAPSVLRQRAAQSARAGANERLRYRVPADGWYYVQVKIGTRGAGPYRLAFTKS